MNKLAAVALSLGTLIFGSLFALYIFCWVTVPAGHVGVVSSFGQVHDGTLTPGGTLVAPWNRVERISCQTQRDEEEANAPTKEGLSCKIKTVLLYHLDTQHVVELVKNTGYTGYSDKLVAPQFRAAIRDATVGFEAEALYTADRAKVEATIGDKVRIELAKNGIIVESIQLLDLAIPDAVKSRIEAKVGAAQDALKMEFVLKQRRLEAEAEIIRATGLAKVQELIQKDLSDSYLKYLAIKALETVSTHGNTVIYVNGDGVPLMANTAAKGK